jgi:recombinational DNA repair protein RecR
MEYDIMENLQNIPGVGPKLAQTLSYIKLIAGTVPSDGNQFPGVISTNGVLFLLR